MEESTVLLLKECGAGLKMAVGSIDHVRTAVTGDKLNRLLEEYRQKHRKLEEKITSLLTENGCGEKDPEPMAKAMSWFTTEIKLSLHGDDKQVAKLMMDGCNMGIQAISEYMHKYSDASRESLDIAKDIVRMEEELMKDMEQFL